MGNFCESTREASGGMNDSVYGIAAVVIMQIRLALQLVSRYCKWLVELIRSVKRVLQIKIK
jgi:hypothetical protein